MYFLFGLIPYFARTDAIFLSVSIIKNVSSGGIGVTIQLAGGIPNSLTISDLTDSETVMIKSAL